MMFYVYFNFPNLRKLYMFSHIDIFLKQNTNLFKKFPSSLISAFLLEHESFAPQRYSCVSSYKVTYIYIFKCVCMYVCLHMYICMYLTYKHPLLCFWVAMLRSFNCSFKLFRYMLS